MARHTSESKKKANPSNQKSLLGIGESDLSRIVSNKLVDIPPGPPKDEDEKRVFFANLIRLRSGERLTIPVCAARMGVSERSIRNYIAEPLYKDMQEQMIAESKSIGHLLISEVIPMSVEGLVSLAEDPHVSPFVRYKCYAELLNYAGFNEPRDESRVDSRATVSQFMKEVEAKREEKLRQQQQAPVYNIQNLTITPEHADKEKVVDAIPSTIPAELHQFYQNVLPGGKLPDSFRTEEAPQPRGILGKRNGTPKIEDHYEKENCQEGSSQEEGDVG